MALVRQPVATLTPQSINRDRQLAQLLLGQRQQPIGIGTLIGGLAQTLAGQRRLERASAGEEQLRQQQRGQLQALLSGLPGGAGSVGGVNLADVLSSPNPALQSVGGAVLQSQLAQPEDTSAIRNFQFAQDNPAFADFLTTTRPQTTVSVGSPNVTLTTGAATGLQNRTLQTQDLLSRLDSIASGFNPEFLTLEGQIRQDLNAFRERALESIGIGELSSAERQSLAEFTAFKRDTTNNLSRFVQELSGAAVTEQEARRLAQSLPTLDDGPTEFQAKLQGAIRDAQRALARNNYALTQGLNPLDTGIPLSGIDAFIDRTGQQIQDRLLAGVPEAQRNDPRVLQEVRAAAVAELRLLFGIQ